MAVKVSDLVKGGISLVAATMIAAAAVKGVPYIKEHEGLVLQTQPDIVGVQNYCYGETHDVMPGKVYTKEQCDLLLDKRFAEYAIAVWNALTPEARAALTPARFLSYISHAYNFGKTAFATSQIAASANAGDVAASCKHFEDWIYVRTPRGGLADRRDRKGQTFVRSGAVMYAKGGLTAKVDGKKDCRVKENDCAGIAIRRSDDIRECLK